MALLAGCGNRAPVEDPPTAEVKRLNKHGLELLAMGDSRRAEEYFLRALSRARALDDLEGQAESLYDLAWVHRDAGAVDDSMTELRLSEKLFGEAGRLDGVARSLAAQGAGLLARNDMEGARRAYARALSEASEEVRAEVLVGRSALFLKEGKTAEARESAENALALAPAREVRADALFRLAQVELSEGQREAARLHLVEALDLDRASDRRRELADTLDFLGRMAQEDGRPAEASRYFARAAGVYEAMGLKGKAEELRSKMHDTGTGQ